MGERELSHLRKSGDGIGVLDGAVAPADLFVGILAGPVLRVVHDQVVAPARTSAWRAIFPKKSPTPVAKAHVNEVRDHT